MKEAGRVQMVEFPLEAGGSVLVQVLDEQAAGPVMRGRIGEVTIDHADRTFEMALGTLRTVKGLAVQPQEVTVEFGVELTGKTGAVLVSAGASAQLKVGLTWRPGHED
jgi:hypothetical protein